MSQSIESKHRASFSLTCLSRVSKLFRYVSSVVNISYIAWKNVKLCIFKQIYIPMLQKVCFMRESWRLTTLELCRALWVDFLTVQVVWPLNQVQIDWLESGKTFSQSQLKPPSESCYSRTFPLRNPRGSLNLDNTQSDSIVPIILMLI